MSLSVGEYRGLSSDEGIFEGDGDCSLFPNTRGKRLGRLILSRGRKLLLITTRVVTPYVLDFAVRYIFRAREQIRGRKFPPRLSPVETLQVRTLHHRPAESSAVLAGPLSIFFFCYLHAPSLRDRYPTEVTPESFVRRERT